MLLQLTVIDARGPREHTVEVRAEEHHTLADLLEALDLPADAASTREAIVENLREVLRRKLGTGQAG